MHGAVADILIHVSSYMCIHFCWLFPHKSSTASVGPAKLYTLSFSTSFMYIYSLSSQVNFLM